MNDPHIPVHIAEIVTLGLVIAGFFLVRRRTYRGYFRLLSALGWANVVLWFVREVMQGFPSPFAGATENIESCMWAADLALCSLVSVVFIYTQSRQGRVSRPWLWMATTLVLGPAVTWPVFFPALLDADGGEVDDRGPVPLVMYGVFLLASLGVLLPHLGLFSETGGAFVLRAVTNPTNTYVVGSICVMFPAMLSWALPSTRSLGARAVLSIVSFMFVAVGFTIVLLMRGTHRGIAQRGSSHV